ncbi:hypothetical protein PSTG_00889 [Puccinia striiformis f. sp. tritici PST-78]|uniref:Uncharacterized protein n=1 Tax=Puccinia striiformis f. sp. tritici PST-78 TaxID=1165861 RepID=A0A0L0W3N8_9BASI|nr:hypothetical protein PSTG_00889 [Puccinia striiformis f. sp. tritici PST-78]
MKIAEAVETFNLSWGQIQRIKGKDPNRIRIHKKRPGKFTDNMKTELLMQLDQKSTTTLVEMAAFIKENWTSRSQLRHLLFLMELALIYIPVEHLGTLPLAKQVMLIGGLLVEGFKYFKLLNANNTKAHLPWQRWCSTPKQINNYNAQHFNSSRRSSNPLKPQNQLKSSSCHPTRRFSIQSNTLSIQSNPMFDQRSHPTKQH